MSLMPAGFSWATPVLQNVLRGRFSYGLFIHERCILLAAVWTAIYRICLQGVLGNQIFDIMFSIVYKLDLALGSMEPLVKMEPRLPLSSANVIEKPSSLANSTVT